MKKMRMVWTIICIYLTIQLFTNCNNSHTKDDNHVGRIYLEDSRDSFNKGVIGNITKVIPLESNPYSLFGQIFKCILTDQRIYIYDSYQSKSINIFDYSGNHLLNYHNTGRGPNEIGYIKDFTVDSRTESIEILDQIGPRIKVFDSLGIYQKSFSVPCSTIEGVKKISEHDYVLSLLSIDGSYFNEIELDSNILFFNSVNNSVKQRLPYIGTSRFYRLSTLNDLSTNYCNQTLFKRSGDLQIYKLVDSDMIPCYTLDFGKSFLPNDLIEKHENSGSDFFNRIAPKSGYVYMISRFIEMEKFIIITYVQSGKSYLSIAERSTGNTIYKSKTKDFVSYITSGGLGTIVGINVDELVLSVSAESFLSIPQSQSFLTPKTGVNNVEPDDNSVLVFVSIRYIE